MKYFLITLLLLSILTPAFAELDDNDLNKIRLLIVEELKPIKSDIVSLKEDVAFIKGKLEDVDKRITESKNLTYTLIALVIAAVGIPQIIIAWRTRTPNGQDKQLEVLTSSIETLIQRIEALENGRIQSS